MDAVNAAIGSALEKLHLKSPEPTFVQPEPRQVQELREQYAKYAQEHVFSFWGDLKPNEQANLYQQLSTIDPARVQSISETVFGTKKIDEVQREISPPPQSAVASTLDASAEELSKWREAGLKAVAEGKVAVLLMAGGQGTRLGSSAPKGCYDIGLPSKKSLFQLQAERLKKLQELAAENHGDRGADVVIPWYIMTSGPTRKDTEDFLKSKNYFGLNVMHC
jgi:UDP-N-acetylglucosamine/UDP-N-acetylgalactosamine diphosphorylase